MDFLGPFISLIPLKSAEDVLVIEKVLEKCKTLAPGPVMPEMSQEPQFSGCVLWQHYWGS